MPPREAHRPERPVNLAFVDLKGDDRPKGEKLYDVVPASSDVVGKLAVPTSAPVLRMVDLTLTRLFVEELPDWTKKNEGLLKLRVNTRDPAAPSQPPVDVTFVTDFTVEEGGFAPTFLYRNVFRNVLFKEHVDIHVNLFELDDDLSSSYHQAQQIVSGVSEFNILDVARGIPYLNIATGLFEGMLGTFGKNANDHIWGESPTLELDPAPGSAFLRSGIYCLFEERYQKDHQGASKGSPVSMSQLQFKNGELMSPSGALPNHLIFNIKIRAQT
jgi:hypothetical protein